MAKYSLALKLVNVDAITGVLVRFDGSIKNPGKSSLFSKGDTPFDGDLEFSVNGRGHILKGEITFEPLNSEASFTTGGSTYSFVDPGIQKLKIRAANPNKSISVVLPTTQPFDHSLFQSGNFAFENVYSEPTL